MVFVADDSKNMPIVHMYRFFEMWEGIPISIKTFNSFYYAYLNELSDLQMTIKMKPSDLKSETFDEFKSVLVDKANVILQEFSNNPYFNYLCKEQYINFLSTPKWLMLKAVLKKAQYMV